MDYSDDNFDAFSGTATQDDREPCGNCGRRFNPDVLARHIPICSKTKKRKPFDTAKQRAEGTELMQLNKPGKGRRAAPAKPIPAKKSNWRAQHEDFINTIRSAKQVSICQEKGLPLPPPPPPSINPDYVQCEYCDRRFNQKAAERHIPFCREKSGRLPAKKPDPKAQQKRNAQIGYKAPRLGANKPTSLAVNSHGGYGSHSAGSGKSPTSPSNYAKRGVTHSSQSKKQYSVLPGIAGGGRTPGGYKSPGSHTSNGAARHDMDSQDSGRPLRTGRTAETYTEARQLSAKQRSTMPRKSSGYGAKSPSSSHPGRYGNHESGYSSNASDDSHKSGPSPKARVGSAARFCHECGSKYPVAQAKFCCECGIRRMSVI